MPCPQCQQQVGSLPAKDERPFCRFTRLQSFEAIICLAAQGMVLAGQALASRWPDRLDVVNAHDQHAHGTSDTMHVRFLRQLPALADSLRCRVVNTVKHEADAQCSSVLRHGVIYGLCIYCLTDALIEIADALRCVRSRRPPVRGHGAVVGRWYARD